MVDPEGMLHGVSVEQYAHLPTEVVEQHHCSMSLTAALAESESRKRKAASKN